MTMNRETRLSLRKFVFHYIVPMFFIALVLVLVTYFNDLRREETKEQWERLDAVLAERDERLTALEQRVSILEGKLKE